VVATEQVTLFGLIIVAGRTVSYGPIKPDEATDIFIRQALVCGRLGRPFAFLEHNQERVTNVVELENRIRRRDLLISDETLAGFYRQRLSNVYDIPSLARRITEKRGDGFLRMAEDDLMNYRPDEGELSLFPERLTAAGHSLELRYRFEPAADADGVTLRVPSTLASGVPPSTLEWLVPGLLREKVELLLKALPKTLRKRLVPLNETVEVILREMPRQTGSLPDGAGRVHPPALRGGHSGIGLDRRDVAESPEDEGGDHDPGRRRACLRPGSGPFAVAASGGPDPAGGAATLGALRHHALGFRGSARGAQRRGIDPHSLAGLPRP